MGAMEKRKELKIAIWQEHIQFGDGRANLDGLREMARQASLDGADLLLVPELALHGYHRASITGAKEMHLPQIQSDLGAISRQEKIAIAGSFVEQHDGFAYNTMVYIHPDGTLAGAYRKTHLFKKLNEHTFFQPGNDLTVLDTPFGRIGLAICYDLRFPEIFRAMSRAGATGFLISAEWPAERIHHWKALLQARGIENQAWVAACNCTGLTGKVEFGGNSMIALPGGDVLCAGADEQLWQQTIQLDQVNEIRKTNPFLEDYRDGLLVK
jgi:omega-amidase